MVPLGPKYILYAYPNPKPDTLYLSYTLNPGLYTYPKPYVKPSLSPKPCIRMWTLWACEQEKASKMSLSAIALERNLPWLLGGYQCLFKGF